MHQSAQKSSIRDVAKAAGVSVATASRVMAKANYPVAEATRLRVETAARDLAFVPNALARGLSRARTDTIGIIVPGITNPYYAIMVEAIDEAARHRGLTTLLGLTSGDEARREGHIDDMVSRRVDGLVICAGAQDHIAGRTPDALGIPAVLIGEQANTGFPIVKTDNHRAGYEAARYLWTKGHRRLLYLTSLASWHDFEERGRGVRAFLDQSGEPYEFQILDGLFSEHDAYDRMRKACEEGLVATAVIASTDRHALGALAAFADASIVVPDQVSVMGFDNYVTSGYIRPGLTTMQMPAAEMGRLAVGLLAAQATTRQVSAETLLVATLVERGSTKMPPS